MPRLVVLLLLLVIQCFPASASAGTSKWSVKKQANLLSLSQEISGSVVYERKGSIYKVDIGSLNPIFLTAGKYPRWSPDGQYVAFLRAHYLMRILSTGGTPQLITSIRSPRAIAYHPDGQQIIFTDGSSIKSVDILSGSVSVFASALSARELDIADDGFRLVATVKSGPGYGVLALNLLNGRRRIIGAGCSASISPDGTMVTNNTTTHKTALIRDWDTGHIVDSVTSNTSNHYDNQYWSNGPLWITAVGTSPSDVFVQNVITNRSVQVTAVGNCSRADLFLRE